MNIDLQDAIDNEKRLKALNLKLLKDAYSCSLCAPLKGLYCKVHEPRLQLKDPNLKSNKVDLLTFTRPEQRERAHKAVDILRKAFGEYRRWIVATKHRVVMISMEEFRELGVRGIYMVVNQDDWSTEDEYEKLVIKQGGELLERARLVRNYTKKDIEVVTELPDGFEQFMPKKTDPSKWKVMQSLNQLEDYLKVKELEKKKNEQQAVIDANDTTNS